MSRAYLPDFHIPDDAVRDFTERDPVWAVRQCFSIPPLMWEDPHQELVVLRGILDRKTHRLTLAIDPSPVGVKGSTKGNVGPATEGDPAV
jgi:hypothetical protein